MVAIGGHAGLFKAGRIGSLIGQPMPCWSGLKSTTWCSISPSCMFAVAPFVNTRFGTMSVIRQFVHGGVTDIGTLWSCPFAGIVKLL